MVVQSLCPENRRTPKRCSRAVYLMGLLLIAIYTVAFYYLGYQAVMMVTGGGK